MGSLGLVFGIVRDGLRSSSLGLSGIIWDCQGWFGIVRVGLRMLDCQGWGCATWDAIGARGIFLFQLYVVSSLDSITKN